MRLPKSVSPATWTTIAFSPRRRCWTSSTLRKGTTISRRKFETWSASSVSATRLSPTQLQNHQVANAQG